MVCSGEYDGMLTAEDFAPVPVAPKSKVAAPVSNSSKAAAPAPAPAAPAAPKATSALQILASASSDDYFMPLEAALFKNLIDMQ